MPDKRQTNNTQPEVAAARWTDPEWLVHADPAQVQAAMDGVTGRSEVLAAAVYRASMRLHHFNGPEVRRHLLALDAARYGDRELSARLAAVPVKDTRAYWTVAWSTGSETDPRLRLTRDTDDPTQLLAAVVIDGRTHIAADYGTGVGVWDLATNEITFDDPPGYVDAFRAAAASRLVVDDRTLTVTHDGTTVQVCDALTGEQFVEPFITSDSVTAVTAAVVDGKHWIIAMSGDHPYSMLWAWELTPREKVGDPVSGHADTASALATTVVNGRAVVVSGSMDKSVRLWDRATGKPVGGPLAGHVDFLSAADTITLNGRPHAVTASLDGTARVWDLAAGLQAGDSLTMHPVSNVSEMSPEERLLASIFGTNLHQLWAVATAEIDGRFVVVTGGDDGAQVWDVATGEPIGAPLTGARLHAVATAEVDSRFVVVTGGDDGAQVWDLATGEPIGAPLINDVVRAIAAGKVNGRTIVVTETDGTIQAWDPLTGQPMGKPMEDRTGWVHALAVMVLDGRPCVVAGRGAGWDYGRLSVWDLTTCERAEEPLIFPHSVRAVASLPDESVVIGFGREIAILARR